MCAPARWFARVNRNLNGQEQFATTFYNGGHPQTGIAPVADDQTTAGIIAKFAKPVSIGTLLVGQLAQPVAAEFYVLKSGQKVGETTPGALPDSQWELFGKSDLARPLSTVTGAAEVTTDALYIRFKSPVAIEPKRWPRLTLCRVLSRRLDRVDEGVHSWSTRTTEPLTETTPHVVQIDLPHETSFDVLQVLNCVNDVVAIDARVNGQWQEIGVLKAGHANVEGSLAASVQSNDRGITFEQTVTTRALRLRVLVGMGGGRFAEPMNKTDALRTEAADVALLKLVEGRRKFRRCSCRCARPRPASQSSNPPIHPFIFPRWLSIRAGLCSRSRRASSVGRNCRQRPAARSKTLC